MSEGNSRHTSKVRGGKMCSLNMSSMENSCVFSTEAWPLSLADGEVGVSILYAIISRGYITCIKPHFDIYYTIFLLINGTVLE